jgi:hypothetical protein
MRVTFLNEPHAETVGNANTWRLTDPFEVEIENDDGSTCRITVPKGAETDLASVPRLPGAYLLFANRGRRSAILHDYLYEAHYPRAWADAVFREAMRNEEVGMFSRFFMWLGVRLGGASHYSGSDGPSDPGGAPSDTYPPQ